MAIDKSASGLEIKRRIEQIKLAWDQSDRKKEIEAEMELPPRPLTSKEKEFIFWILELQSEEARSYLPQVEGMNAVRWDSCGCPSIKLIPSEDAPLGVPLPACLVCDIQGETEKGEKVGVILFQKAGKLDLLEVYPTFSAVGPPEYGFPTFESMKSVVSEPVPGNPNVRVAAISPESPA